MEMCGDVWRCVEMCGIDDDVWRCVWRYVEKNLNRILSHELPLEMCEGRRR